MKRWSILLLVVAILLSTCSCKSDSAGTPSEPSTPSMQVSALPESQDTPEPTVSEEEGDRGGIEVEQGLFNVTLTIPAEFSDEGITQEQLDQTAGEKGYKSATLNEDGSITYIMTKSQHDEMMQEIKKSIDDGLDEIVGSDEYPSISKIEANDDYSQYKVFLNVEEVSLSESFVAMGLYMYGGMYHVFNGTEVNNINVQFVSESTGKVLQEANSSDIG